MLNHCRVSACLSFMPEKLTSAGDTPSCAASSRERCTAGVRGSRCMIRWGWKPLCNCWAWRTSTSTEEIAKMVQQIQHSTREAVTSMEAGVTQVDKGMRVTTEVERAIADILQATLNTTQLVNDITRTIGEQSLASNEIAHQVETIASMSQSNSQTVSETAYATDELNRLASALSHSVDRFRL